MTLDEFLTEWYADSPMLTVHTSGSTGQPKAISVEKRRMEASARLTCRFLDLQAGQTALLCLPLDFIAGKMMVVRALTCGLRLVSVDPDSHPLRTDSLPDSHPLRTDSPIDFAAMVPLQVVSSLQVPEERQRLMAIRHLIIGGGPIDDDLADRLRSFPNNVWSTYGMTETLSHVALRRLSGPDASRWYTPFHGVTIATNDDGCLLIDAPAVCDRQLLTNDLAELRPDGCFRILGRKDNVVCSGGLKIQIEEVERLLHPHLAVPFCITKASDPLLGEAVVMLTESTDVESIATVCQRVLPRHWKPRRYVTVDHIPLTATGKIARKEARQLAQQSEHTVIAR